MPEISYWNLGLMRLFKEHDVIVVARNGSPIVLGQGDGESFVSSDPHALTPHTQRVVYLDDGQVAVLDSNGIEVSRLHGGQIDTNVTLLENEWGVADLGDYPHFMLKEIYEQPEALRQCVRGRMDLATGNGRLRGLKKNLQN